MFRMYYALALPIGICLGAQYPAFGAVLSGSSEFAFYSAQVSISLDSGPSESVAALQFDLVYPPDVFSVQSVLPGGAAATADKDVEFFEVEPGRLRVLVVGFNMNVIPDGVVASLMFDVARWAPEDTYFIGMQEVVLTTPLGGSVPCDVSTAQIAVDIPEMPMAPWTWFLMAGLLSAFGCRTIRGRPVPKWRTERAPGLMAEPRSDTERTPRCFGCP